MKKLHKIVVIPIQKEVEVGDLIRHFNQFEIAGIPKQIGCPCQLLLLSDNEIKKGEDGYVLFDKVWRKPQENGGRIVKVINHYQKTPKHAREYVLENNQTIDIEDCTNKIIASYPKIETLPTFSEDFIKEWIKNPVEELEIEYESFFEDGWYEHLIVNVNDNNEVICNIPKSNIINNLEKERNETTYTEQEVKNLCSRAWLMQPHYLNIISEFENWFNKYKK